MEILSEASDSDGTLDAPRATAHGAFDELGDDGFVAAFDHPLAKHFVCRGDGVVGHVRDERSDVRLMAGID